MRRAFGCWVLTDLYVVAENWRQKFDLRDCGSLFGHARGHLQSCCVFLWLDAMKHIMPTWGYSSPIWAHRAQAHRMPSSHDAKGSIQMDMCSLGVVDLDLSISPDAFGLRAFDHKKPLTRMLPGSSPCELRLMLPDSALGSDGFHDILVDNLAASTTWMCTCSLLTWSWLSCGVARSNGARCGRARSEPVWNICLRSMGFGVVRPAECGKSFPP